MSWKCFNPKLRGKHGNLFWYMFLSCGDHLWLAPQNGSTIDPKKEKPFTTSMAETQGEMNMMNAQEKTVTGKLGAGVYWERRDPNKSCKNWNPCMLQKVWRNTGLLTVVDFSSRAICFLKYPWIPALPKDIGNEHVRIKDILYLKFMFYHIAIPSLHYIFWNAYEEYKTPRSKKLQRRRIYSS